MNHWTANDISLFRASMLELCVLALLIVVLVGSIRVTRAGSKPAEPGKDLELRQRVAGSRA